MKVFNKKAKFLYEILEKIEAGIILTGAEVKSVKQGHISFAQAHVRIHEGQAWLIGAAVSPYKFADNRDYDPNRTRKLLLTKKEIFSLKHKIEGKNLVLVPTMIYTSRGKVKLEIALAKPKKLWQKKEVKKEADLEREAARDLKNWQ